MSTEDAAPMELILIFFPNKKNEGIIDSIRDSDSESVCGRVWRLNHFVESLTGKLEPPLAEEKCILNIIELSTSLEGLADRIRSKISQNRYKTADIAYAEPT